jgi:hypothetical protein
MDLCSRWSMGSDMLSQMTSQLTAESPADGSRSALTTSWVHSSPGQPARHVFGTLRSAQVHEHADLTRGEAGLDVFHFIERFYK